MPKSPPIVLSIAGFDPSAGAGVLADLKTFAAAGVYGMGCVTAPTVQSSQGVRKTTCMDVDTVVETLDCLAEDVRFAAIKVGMLGNAIVAAAVAAWLEQRKEVPVVLDPVLKSSSGKDLLDAEGLDVLRSAWLARADWITPNLPELGLLTRRPVPKTQAEMEEAARHLQKMAANQGNPALRIVVTGGHSNPPDDLLLDREHCEWFTGERIETTASHGTGCAFSSTLAARIALGDAPSPAVRSAKDYVTGALRYAYPIGKGNGPINHFWRDALHIPQR